MQGSLVNNRGGTGTTGLPMKRTNYSILQNISGTEPSARRSIWSGVEQLPEIQQREEKGTAD